MSVQSVVPSSHWDRELELTDSLLLPGPGPSSSASKGKNRPPPSAQVEKEVIPVLPKEGGYIGEMVVQAMAMGQSHPHLPPHRMDAHTPSHSSPQREARGTYW